MACMKSSQASFPLEMWGGVECSLVRLADRTDDQVTRTGHGARLDDLDRLADLGLRTVRYPVLWQQCAAPYDWRWADERLGRLQELGIRPIVGFLHHGCGPLPGGFLDPGFVDGLTKFAREFARRFPWVDAYTPVNEPLTTARFSGMYGLWHPGARDAAVFARIFLVECTAIRAAMAAVRETNPTAQLVQTEDIGKTHSTPLLAYQADFENERRWLTYDLLCGRVDPESMLGQHLRYLGVPAEDLLSFVRDPCPPDVLGMNHYVTSERFIDEHLEHYPAHHHGGNGRDAYADVPAVRVRAEGVVGPAALLREAWERYHRPLAITEVQLACTREEQVRWLCEMWAAARDARDSGADVRAVTAWALFGAYDWDTLLVNARGHYENGAFTLRAGRPQETAVGAAIRQLALVGNFSHPLLATPGWWRRPERLVFSPVSATRTGTGTAVTRAEAGGAPMLLVVVHRTDLLRDICALRGLPARIVPPAEATEFAPLSSAAWWGVLMDRSCPDQIETECVTYGLPWARLPVRYNRRAIRRTLDRLIDLACVEGLIESVC
jgi:dTDP-4-dehydrorhamnose reductase